MVETDPMTWGEGKGGPKQGEMTETAEQRERVSE